MARLKLEDVLEVTGVLATLTATIIDVPWALADGLVLFEGGSSEDIELGSPSSAAVKAPIIVLHRGRKTAFVAQRWARTPIARWRAGDAVNVNTHWVCVAPQSLAGWEHELEGPAEASVADRALTHAVIDVRLPVPEHARPALAIAVRQGEGSYPLWIGVDAAGDTVAWVIDFGIIKLAPPNGPAAVDFPGELAPYAKQQRRYALACRDAPTTTFAQVVAELNLEPGRARPSRDPWGGASIGQLVIKRIEIHDYGWYEPELVRIALPAPALLLRLMFEYHHITRVPQPIWRAMLAVFSRLGGATRGVIYSIEDDTLPAIELANGQQERT